MHVSVEPPCQSLDAQAHERGRRPAHEQDGENDNDSRSRTRLRGLPVTLALSLAGFVAFAPVRAAGPTHVSGTISTDTTWTLADSPYILDGPVTVATGVTLTLEAGVVVKSTVNWDRRLDVNGTLRADARSGARIYFTSLYDDTVAGDTNGDGSATRPAAGNWAGVAFRAGSGGTLGNVEIRYGGAWDWNAALPSNLYLASSAVTVASSTITAGSSSGMAVDGSATPTVNGNTVSGNAAWAFRTAIIDSTKNIHGNAVSANLYNGLYIGNGTLSTDVTWDETSFPYVADFVTVPLGRTLTIRPGVIYKSSINWDRRFEVYGTLVAGQAAPAAKVTFTDVYDDSAGGDTTGDGTATQPANGNWAGIAFRAGAAGSLTNVDLAWGGAWDWAAGAPSALYINSSAVTVAGSTIRRSGSRGIWIDAGGTPDVGTSAVIDNAGSGFRIQGIPAAVHDNTISNNGAFAIEVVGATGTAGLARNTGTGNTNQGVYVSGTLAQNASWERTFPWVVDGVVAVNAGTTLTLQPGVVVKGTPSFLSGFNVYGTLSAQGSPAQHVTLTSYRDDTAGGDTNADGTATAPARGDWSGACYRAGSSGSLAYTDLRWGGGWDFSAGGPSLVYTTSSGVSIDHATFGGSYSHGIFVEGGATPAVTNSTFTNIAGWPIWYNSPDSTAGTQTGNSATGNGINGAHVGGTLATSARWSDSLPYVVDVLTVNPGVTLRIDPGRVVKATANWDRRVEVHGTLLANGTAGSPVVFTALADDTAGGDTNADGTASSPGAGGWAGIAFRAGSTSNQLTYADVRYAGAWDWAAGSPSAVYVNSSATTVDHVTVRGSASLGIAVDGSTRPQLTYNTLSDHGSWAIRLNDIDSANPQIHDNTSTGANSGTYVYGGTLDGTATFAEVLMPYVYDFLNVTASGNLTIDPGAVFKATVNWDRRIEVSGTLTAGQASAAKVHFTSFVDDTVGGDTNGDGTASAPAPGTWAGLAFRSGNANCVLTNVEVRYGGAWDWSVGGPSSVMVAAGAPKFTALTVTDSQYFGAWIGGGAPEIATCRMTRNGWQDIGLAASAAVTPNIHDCTSLESVWYQGNGARVRWTRNIFNNWGAKGSRVSVDDVGALTSSTNTFNGVTGASLEVWNGATGYDGTWGPAAGPIVVQGYVDIYGTDGADGVTTVTLAPGTLVRFVRNGVAGFRVGVGAASPPGALVADALSGDRIVLTSADPVPNPGYWQGIVANASGRVTLRNVLVAYADFALWFNGGTAALLDTVQFDRSNVGAYFVSAATPQAYSEITTSNDAYGIISSNSVPVFRDSQLLGSVYGVRNDTPAAVVDARQNWWGDPSGPGPVGPGTGTKITVGVLYDGWQTAPADDGDGVPLHAGPTPDPCTCGNEVDCDDNCPLVANPSQVDADCDGVGDGCDTNPTLTVSSDPDDHTDYARIEDAVNAAYQSGTTILIYPGLGPYRENVRTDRYMQFAFRGREGGAPVIVDGGGNPAFYVQNKVGSAPTILENLTLRGYEGIQALVDTSLTRLSFDQVANRALDLNGGTHSLTDADIGPLVPTGAAVAGGATLTADRVTVHEFTSAGILAAGTVSLGDALIVGGIGGADGVHLAGGNVTLRFTTIAGNTGYGITAAAGGTATVSDSIVYGNGSGDLQSVPCSAATRTDIGSVDCTAVNANLHANPVLTADFHLGGSSPCLDHGADPQTYHGDPPFDRAGGPRLLDWDGDGLARTDCGAYEHANGTLTPPEVAGVEWPLRTRMAWSPTPGAVRYHIYRDGIENLSYANFGACRDDLDPSGTDTQLDDASLPPAGKGFFYLVAAVNDAGHAGTLGAGTSAERSNYRPCP